MLVQCIEQCALSARPFPLHLAVPSALAPRGDDGRRGPEERELTLNWGNSMRAVRPSLPLPRAWLRSSSWSCGLAESSFAVTRRRDEGENWLMLPGCRLLDRLEGWLDALSGACESALESGERVGRGRAAPGQVGDDDDEERPLSLALLRQLQPAVLSGLGRGGVGSPAAYRLPPARSSALRSPPPRAGFCPPGGRRGCTVELRRAAATITAAWWTLRTGRRRPVRVASCACLRSGCERSLLYVRALPSGSCFRSCCS